MVSAIGTEPVVGVLCDLQLIASPIHGAVEASHRPYLPRGAPCRRGPNVPKGANIFFGTLRGCLALFGEERSRKVKAALAMRAKGAGYRKIAREVGLGVSTVMRLTASQEISRPFDDASVAVASAG